MNTFSKGDFGTKSPHIFADLSNAFSTNCVNLLLIFDLPDGLGFVLSLTVAVPNAVLP